MKSVVFLSVVFGINVLNIMATKTKIILTVPEKNDPLSVDVEMEEISIYGAVKGIPIEDLKNWSNQKEDEVCTWLNTNENNIKLTIIYDTESFATSDLNPTFASDRDGQIVSFGFKFQFMELPYPKVSVTINFNSPKFKQAIGTSAYMKEATSELIFHFDKNSKPMGEMLQNSLKPEFKVGIQRIGMIFELGRNPKITIPLTMIPSDESLYLIMSVDRSIQVWIPNSELSFTGLFKQRENKMELSGKTEGLTQNFDKINWKYSNFPNTYSPTVILDTTFRIALGSSQNSSNGNAVIEISQIRDVISSGNILAEGTVTPGTEEITIVVDEKMMEQFTHEVRDIRSSWHVTLAGVQTKWIRNPKIKQQTLDKTSKLCTLIVAFEYVV